MNIMHLEVNDSGGWRRVMSFDGDASTRLAVMQNAYYMLNCSNNPKLRARIIAPGDTAPMVTWTVADGWKEWRA